MIVPQLAFTDQCVSALNLAVTNLQMPVGTVVLYEMLAGVGVAIVIVVPHGVFIAFAPPPVIEAIEPEVIPVYDPTPCAKLSAAACIA